MTEHTQNQRERLNYLEFRAYFTGQVSRSDLIQRFGISEAAATRDLAIYREETTGNLEFDSSGKIYRITSGFTPHYIKDVEPKLLLRALIHGSGNDFGSAPESLIPCELPSRLQAPAPDVLAAVSRAIFQKGVVRMEYFSGTGNHGLREIVPFSLAGTGLKWMVRAYCRRNRTFCHFVLNRIKTAEVVPDQKPNTEETKEYDDEWNRMLRLELIAHPGALNDDRAKTEQEFQMTNGVYVLRVRAALASFVLRLWGVDCSSEERLSLLPLCLRNKVVLHDVKNAFLSPGYATSNTPVPDELDSDLP